MRKLLTFGVFMATLQAGTAMGSPLCASCNSEGTPIGDRNGVLILAMGGGGMRMGGGMSGGMSGGGMSGSGSCGGMNCGGAGGMSGGAGGMGGGTGAVGGMNPGMGFFNHWGGAPQTCSEHVGKTKRRHGTQAAQAQAQCADSR